MEHSNLQLPQYEHFNDSIAVLSLPLTASELHGMMCGYVCAGADSQGEAYLRALVHNKKDEDSRNALLALFSVFSISQQQITHLDFQFTLLLPDDETDLFERAKAFSEWCDGFIRALALSGVESDQFYEEETQEALQHITEFADIDFESLDVDEEDEKALVEVSEYTRLAVIRLHADLNTHEKEQTGSDTTH